MKIIREGEMVILGPFTSGMFQNAKWTKEDEFPSNQQWADEFEKVLAFAHREGQLHTYTPRLVASASQRGSALAELRVAFHLNSKGLRISRWEPPGLSRKQGEFVTVDNSGTETFVEVKSPGWEGELSNSEIMAGRAKKPKYINAETRSIAPWERIRFAVEKSYIKFTPDFPNMLVIADDLFVGLDYRTDHMAGIALYSRHNNGPFTTISYERLGGAGIFWVDNKSMAYIMKLYINPFALSNCAIPNNTRAILDGVELNIS